MRFLEDLRVPLPKVFALAAQFVLNNRIRRSIEKEPLDVAAITSLLQQAKTRRITLDTAQLSFQLRQLLKRVGERFRNRPGDAAALVRIEDGSNSCSSFPSRRPLGFENIVYEVLLSRYPIMKKRAESGDETAGVASKSVGGRCGQRRI
jgi:hypothetical protein